MDNIEETQSEDDFDIQITSIDESKNSDSSSSFSRSPLTPRFSHRQRKLQLLITASIVILVLLMLLESSPLVRGKTISFLFPLKPAPTQVTGSGLDSFYIQGSPSWGRVAIDGKSLAYLPTIGSDQPLKLSAGLHKFVWRAEPFQLQSCTVSVPFTFASENNTCPFSEPVPVGAEHFAEVIKFSESPAMLSVTQLEALLQATQAALDTLQSNETVRTGEFYALSSENSDAYRHSCKVLSQTVLCFAIATQKLRARLHFQLDTDTSQGNTCTTSGECTFQGQDCRLFCDVSMIDGPLSSSWFAPGWNVFALIHSFWQYTTFNGQIIASKQADTSIEGQGNEHLVPLHITWNSPGWYVSVLSPSSQNFFRDPVCDSAQDDAHDLDIDNFVINNVPIQPRQQLAAGTALALGCVIMITPQAYSATTHTPSPSPTPLIAYCLHRFGVLLAANALAHRLWPYLPQADTYEQNLAQELAANLII